MIIVRIVGGLASQMHKYAVGRALALRRGSRLKLDLGAYQARSAADTPWPYELDKFSVAAEAATPEEIRARRGTELGNRVARRLRRAFGFSLLKGRSVDRSGMTPEEFAALPDDVYLQGEWAGDAYFSDIRPTLLSDFRLKAPPSEKCEALRARIAAAAYPVAIHVRRGDYITNPHAQAFHCLTGLDYYLQAARLIREKRPEASFFAFSDDPAWVAAELLPRLPAGSRAVNGTTNHEDLLLMSSCRGNIICNSGFSWMAAWLNDGADRLVVAPRLWVKDAAANAVLLRDLFRGDWATVL